MATKPTIPTAQATVADQRGAMTVPWYTFFSKFTKFVGDQFDAIAAVQSGVTVLQAQVDAIPTAQIPFWGNIGGDLPDQSDLQAALDLKLNHAQTMRRVSLGF